MESASENFANIDQLLINGESVTKPKVDELKQELASCGLEKSGLMNELQKQLCKASCNDERNAKTSMADTKNSLEDVNGIDSNANVCTIFWCNQR